MVSFADRDTETETESPLEADWKEVGNDMTDSDVESITREAAIPNTSISADDGVSSWCTV